MKKLFPIVIAVVLLFPAAAQARDFRYGFGVQEREQRANESRKYQRGDRERSRDREERRMQRLTEEERRELHRDLDRAHREIYRRRQNR